MRTSCLKAMTAACVVIVALSLAVPVAAPIGYIGLYDDSHFLWFLDEVDPYELFDVYVWAIPGDNGLICGEFDVTYDDILILSGFYDNPEALILVEPDPDGMTVCFGDCRTDWVWLRRFEFLTTSTGPGHVYLDPHPVSGALQFYSCLDGNPAEVAAQQSIIFCVNDPYCHVAVSQKSWGAIKAIYEE